MRHLRSAAFAGGLCLVVFMTMYLLPVLLTSTDGLDDPVELASARNGVRTACVALVLAIGAMTTASIGWRTFQLNRAGQVVDRYSNAITQLGSDSVETRLGGIFALEKIGADDAHYLGTVEEVLAAYVRHRSPARAAQGKRKGGAAERSAAPQPREDVRAAVGVLARRPARPDARRLDLRRANLSGLDEPKALLTGVRLTESTLTGARLPRADLQGATLVLASAQRASLRDARLHGVRADLADLSGASLLRADISGGTIRRADLSSADLRSVALRDADLSDSTLRGALLCGADLSGANLDRTDLTAADLTGCDLREASLAGALLRSAKVTRGSLSDAQLAEAIEVGTIRWTEPEPDPA